MSAPRRFTFGKSFMLSIEPSSSVPETTLRALQIGMTSAESGGGGERYYFNLMRALPAAGVRAIGLVAGDAAQLVGQAGVTSFAADNAGFLRRWPALRREVASAAPDSDVVVSHFAPHALPILDVVRSRPFVVHFHGPWALESAAEGGGKTSVLIKSTIERIVYSRASRFIVLSRAFGAILEREYGVRNDKIRIVPGGVELRRFGRFASKHAAKEILGWPTDRPTVLTVRRLVHAKGVENLIDAVVAIRRVVPDVLIVIAGSGPLARDLKRRVRNLELDHWVCFAGFVPEEQLPTMYRAADLFVVPTVALEGFGLVVLEALACGTPVLVTPIAGLPEVVADLEPGLVLAGAGPDELARGIGDALCGRLRLPDEDECVLYAERFDWPVIGQRIAAVYREVA
jgi:glycosyltransferase involved in cell wall biosynthesis